MTIGLIGRKVGMTQLFQDDGTMIPVSVLAVEPNTVTRVRTPERDGYTAVQLGIEESGKLTKPEIGQLKNLPMLAVLREFRLEGTDDPAYTVGQKLDVSLFAAGDIVQVTGVSKGKASRATSSATTSSAVPRLTARTITAPQARSAPAPRPAASTRGCAWPATWATPAPPSRSCGSSERTPSATCCSSRVPFPAPRTG